MKLIIAGGREYQFTDQDTKTLDDIHKDFGITEVLSGHSGGWQFSDYIYEWQLYGADRHGEHWARDNNIPYKMFIGQLQAMINKADSLIIFPGDGDYNGIIGQAKGRGIKVFDPYKVGE